MEFNQIEIAAIQGVTPKTIQNWQRSKGFPAIQDDQGLRYNAADCTTWRIKYETGSSLDAERTRLTKEQADKTEMENSVRRGDLVELPTVATEIDRMIYTAKSKLLAVPSQVAPYLEHKDKRDIESQLTDVIYECLSDMANPTSTELDTTETPDS